MMNVVALGLVLSSLVTASVFSPSPPEKQTTSPICEEDDLTTILKEGHRGVVVEFEKDGHTKVSISPQEHEAQQHTSHQPPIHEAQQHTTPSNISDLVCDALGKCKHKVASALGKAKEKVFETAHEVSENAQEVEQHGKETISEPVGKTKEKAHVVTEKAHEVEEHAKETISEALGKAKKTVSDKAHGVKKGTEDTIRETAHEVKETIEESAKEMAKKAKHGAETVLDKSKNVSRTIDSAKEKAEHVADRAKAGAKKLEREAEKDLNEILRRGREVGYDMWKYVASRRTMEAAMGVAHLVGFSTAYGMCIWVTFVSSFVLAKALPRQQFGVVQSKIYPVYFTTMAYCVLLALIGHLLAQRRLLFSSVAVMLQAYYLLASLLMVLFNLLYLEPRATKVMYERMKIEKEEGRGRDYSISEPSRRAAEPPVVHADHPIIAPAAGSDTISTPSGMPETPEEAAVKARIVELTEKLKILNAYSSFVNILTLMVLSWYLVHLGHHLTFI